MSQQGALNLLIIFVVLCYSGFLAYAGWQYWQRARFGFWILLSASALMGAFILVMTLGVVWFGFWWFDQTGGHWLDRDIVALICFVVMASQLPRLVEQMILGAREDRDSRSEMRKQMRKQKIERR